MFPDSKVAEDLTLSDTKASYIVNFGLGPYVRHEEEDVPHVSPQFDESLNAVVQRVQFDCHVKYWNGDGIEIRYLGSAIMGRPRSTDFSDAVCDVAPQWLLKKLIHLSMDGPNAILWKHRSASHGKGARRQERAKNNEKYNEALSIEQQGPGLHRASISAPQLSAVRPLRKETVEVAKRRHEVEESQRRIHGDLNAAKTALTLAAGRGRGVAVTPPPGFGPRPGYEAVETFRIGRGTFRVESDLVRRM
ncbi:unnamed protein product [Cyprideis torosa]|uniref:Uncharacterized protein n=1 Tax=Cyprideis torosa TaxID=163714 RepID=A0A7R8ZNX8_9CRUS|nr:unnamed protein product [Cyprideis torosa]CAG0899094.1 unnamed protein product [Cyprideis torosa]